ncbi:hypothetical protein [Paracoccus aminophilus]|nr:hypothetical protein [Paracoccus aminophilus]
MTPATWWGCIGYGWTPEIGDPNIWGWLTVLSYLICCGLSLAAAGRLRGRGGRGLWCTISGLMLFLGINKQLDLQTALTDTGRCLAHLQEWYEGRQLIQMLFIGGLFVIISAIFALALANMRGKLRANLLAFLGLFVLLTFVMVRAVGFHHMDALISAQIASVSLNFVFENVGLLMIAANAVAILRATAPERRGQPA